MSIAREAVDAATADARAVSVRNERAIAKLWDARSVAVVGASDKPGSIGRLPVEHLLRYGFGGAIYPVRPDGAPVAGLRSYETVQACPTSVDLVMIMVGAERVAAAVDDCVAAGVPTAIVCSSGFAETGPAGAALQDDIVARARAGGVRVVGPNCIGAVGVDRGLVASFSPLFSGPATTLVPGPIGFVSQSGALGYGAVSLAFERGLGLGWIVNTGNEADVTALEVMAQIAELPDCTGVLGYVERLDDVRTLRRLASSGKPVALLKAGRSTSGQRAAASHTGALATEDRVVDAALRQLGIVRADDVEELLDLGDAFAQPRRPRGRDVAVVTTSGGSGILAADAIEAYGLTLAGLGTQTVAALDAIVPAYGSTANPVDVTATVMSDPALFDRTLEVVTDDPAVDAVIACFCVLTAADVGRVVDSLARTADRSGKPVLAARTGASHLALDAAAALRAAGIPTFPTPARAVRALAGLRQVTDFAARGSPPATVTAGRPRGGPAASRGGAEGDSSGDGGSAVDRLGADRSRPDEIAVKATLAAAGISVPRGRRADSPADAAVAVNEVGGRAVLKAVVPGIVHKTEAGGVALGVGTDDAAAAYERLLDLGGDVLVEEMVSGGVEALVGIATSPLGPVLTVGVGGTLTEVVDDVALRLLSLSPPTDWTEQVDAMVDETRLGRLLAGARGSGPYDRPALVDAVVALRYAVRQWQPGFELDLNPVAVLPAGQGVCVLDAAYMPPTEAPTPAMPPHLDAGDATAPASAVPTSGRHNLRSSRQASTAASAAPLGTDLDTPGTPRAEER